MNETEIQNAGVRNLGIDQDVEQFQKQRKRANKAAAERVMYINKKKSEKQNT